VRGGGGYAGGGAQAHRLSLRAADMVRDGVGELRRFYCTELGRIAEAVSRRRHEPCRSRGKSSGRGGNESSEISEVAVQYGQSVCSEGRDATDTDWGIKGRRRLG
jgi:hypothetical protein